MGFPKGIRMARGESLPCCISWLPMHHPLPRPGAGPELNPRRLSARPQMPFCPAFLTTRCHPSHEPLASPVTMPGPGPTPRLRPPRVSGTISISTVPTLAAAQGLCSSLHTICSALLAPQPGRYCYPHAPDRQPEAQRDETTRPGSCSPNGIAATPDSVAWPPHTTPPPAIPSSWVLTSG